MFAGGAADGEGMRFTASEPSTRLLVERVVLYFLATIIVLIVAVTSATTSTVIM
jgi:hypothetical protein